MPVSIAQEAGIASEMIWRQERRLRVDNIGIFKTKKETRKITRNTLG
jgi:hypothetical protein